MKNDNSDSILQRNIQALATEMFKIKHNIASEIMKKLFAPKMTPNDLRNNNSFKRRGVNSKSKYGSLKDVHVEYAKNILDKLGLY